MSEQERGGSSKQVVRPASKTNRGAVLLLGSLVAVLVLGALMFTRSPADEQTQASSHRVQASAAKPSSKRYMVPVSMSQPKLGPDTAPVTVVEWCDLNGEKCRKSAELLRRLVKEYGDQVRHVWRHYPTEKSEYARDMHEVAHAAFENAGKFWPLRDALLERDRAPNAAELKEILARLGIDWSVAEQSLGRHAHAGSVLADSMFAAKFGVAKVPALFVNGRRVEGAFGYENIKGVVEEELARAKALLAKGITAATVYDEMIRDADSGMRVDTSSLAKRP